MKKFLVATLALLCIGMWSCKKDGQAEPAEDINITLQTSDLELQIGRTYQLTATVTPAGQPLSWASGNESIAAVNPSGIVTALSEGSCDITVSAGTKSAVCHLSVIDDSTFVPTTVKKRIALIEEFTGVYCGWCPEGHKIVQKILQDNKGKVLAINEHAGSFAATIDGVTYKTDFGEAYADQSGLTGYPAGTISRHVFSGGVTALSRDKFAYNTHFIITEDSPVNIAATASIDCSTRKLVVRVQAYYTSSSAAQTNQLNVALLQDDVVGRQVGADKNPDQGTEYAYHHMHMLRHMLTGTWGETVTTTTQGSLVKRTYVYDIPEVITTVPAVLENLKVICFICESHQEVINCCEAKITLL